MKIVYISDSAIPSKSPNSVHVMKMCQAFASLGHEVTLHAKNTTQCLSNVKEIHAFYSVSTSFDIDIFPSRPFKGSGAFYNFSLLWRTGRMTGDLLYTRSITAAYLLLKRNKPVVFELHEPYETKGWRLRKMFEYIIHHSRLRKLVVISDALRQHVVKTYKGTHDLVVVAHDAADPFEKASALIKDNNFKVGYTGSLLKGKGLEILIPLARQCQDIEFHVVGGSEEQIRQIKINHPGISNLVFHGFKPQRELPAYIESFDVLIAPYTAEIKVNNRTDANNLALWMSPLKIFEYMSAARPIVTTDLPVIREILTDGYNAILCSAHDIGQWRNALEALRKDGGMGKRIAENALKDFVSKYTWKQRAIAILNDLRTE